MIDQGIGLSGYHTKYYSGRDWSSYVDILSHIIKCSLPGPILDLGAGCGFFLEVASLWGIKSIGLEGSQEAIDLAKRRSSAIDIRLHRLSETLPFQNESFQTVLLNQVIEHLEEQVAKKVIMEAFRVLRPQGMLMITSPSKANRYETRADPTHINMMTPTELKKLLLNCGFREIRSFNLPLAVFGKNKISRVIMLLLFKLMPLDLYSASSNAIAFKR